jgi:hypothetical protein
MDDFLFFTRTHWQLRSTIAQLGYFFEFGGFEQHPHKIQIGKMSNGFDWLSPCFDSQRTTLSPRALQNHQDQRVRLFYEQTRRQLVLTMRLYDGCKRMTSMGYLGK